MSEAMKNQVRSCGSRLARRQLLRMCGLCVELATGWEAGSARATPTPTILVLSVAEEGRQQDALRKQVGDLVQRTGARLAESQGLSASARACADPGCLDSLAKESRADYVLAARIERRSRHDRLIDMWLYGTQAGTDRSEQELCDVRDVRDCLSSLAGKLIGPQLGAGPGDEPAPSPAPGTPTAAEKGATAVSPALSPAGVSKPPTQRTPQSSRTGLPGWRLGLGIGFGALAVGALATAIGDTVLNGQSGAGSGCMSQGLGCVYDLRIPLIAGYVTAGVFATGAALSFFLPTSRPARKENP